MRIEEERGLLNRLKEFRVHLKDDAKMIGEILGGILKDEGKVDSEYLTDIGEVSDDLRAVLDSIEEVLERMAEMSAGGGGV